MRVKSWIKSKSLSRRFNLSQIDRFFPKHWCCMSYDDVCHIMTYVYDVICHMISCVIWCMSYYVSHMMSYVIWWRMSYDVIFIWRMSYDVVCHMMTTSYLTFFLRKINEYNVLTQKMKIYEVGKKNLKTILFIQIDNLLIFIFLLFFFFFFFFTVPWPVEKGVRWDFEFKEVCPSFRVSVSNFELNEHIRPFQRRICNEGISFEISLTSKKIHLLLFFLTLCK